MLQRLSAHVTHNAQPGMPASSMTVRWIVIISLCFAANVCAAASPAQGFPQGPIPESELKSAEYRLGYRDGCLHATDGLLRNDARFATDTAFRDGWFKGNANCHPQLDMMQTKGDPNGPMKNLF